MKIKASFLLSLSLVLLSGCASGPAITPQQIAAAEVGPLPSEREHRAILGAMELILNDPRSAEYKWGEAHKDALSTGNRITYGWEVPVLVNAKNSMGGYTGFQRWAFFLVDGRVVSYQDPRMARMDFWTPVK